MDQGSDTWAEPPRHVVIIGGSLSGLMHGIMLHRLGISVRILEQSTSETPDSHVAGVCLGTDVLRFLQRFDRMAEVPIGIPSVQLQSLQANGGVRPFLKVYRTMSSWDALYFRLRANFDLESSLYLSGTAPNTDAEPLHAISATAEYETGKRVLRIESTQTGKVAVVYEDIKNGGPLLRSEADLVLGADGPNSVMRKAFLEPGKADRAYAGYIAWRGVVPEQEVSEKTREVFRSNITYSILGAEAGHVIVYNIPGPKGSLETGKRLLNFCWYTNVELSSLKTIMTDVDGRYHHTKVAPGQVNPDVWVQQRAYARTVFSGPYREILDRIDSPFIHLITDYCAPRVSFAEGKCLLVGDAAALLRPHIAYSTNQAAYHTSLTERLVKGEITSAQWEYQVSVTAYLHWQRSVWYGEYFQSPIYKSISSGVYYWMLLATAKVRFWLGWLPEPVF